jgi:hypothetical protein
VGTSFRKMVQAARHSRTHATNHDLRHVRFLIVRGDKTVSVSACTDRHYSPGQLSLNNGPAFLCAAVTICQPRTRRLSPLLWSQRPAIPGYSFGGGPVSGPGGGEDTPGGGGGGEF